MSTVPELEAIQELEVEHFVAILEAVVPDCGLDIESVEADDLGFEPVVVEVDIQLEDRAERRLLLEYEIFEMYP
jgi:hypothetical protein